MIVLTSSSTVLRPERTGYLLIAARAIRLARAVSATMSALHCTCAPGASVVVEPPHTGARDLLASVLLWGLCCTERTDDRSDLSFLRHGCCLHLRASETAWLSAKAVAVM